jgi:hypothetical protein
MAVAALHDLVLDNPCRVDAKRLKELQAVASVLLTEKLRSRVEVCIKRLEQAGPVKEGWSEMDDEGFRRAAYDMVDWIISYRNSASDYPVRSQVKPGYLFKMLPGTAPAKGEKWTDIAADIDRCIVPGLTHWESKKFFAYFKPSASYPSVLGELLCAGINVMGFSWISSPGKGKQ